MDERRKELERLGEAATPGPWEARVGKKGFDIWSDLWGYLAAVHSGSPDEANAAYIVAAANACRPGGWLVAEVRRLQSIIDAHDLCHDLHGKVGPQEFADGCTAEQRKLYGCAPDRDELARLRDRLAAARAGLEPFAVMHHYADEELSHLTGRDKLRLNEHDYRSATYGDARRAAELLAEPEEPDVV